MLTNSILEAHRINSPYILEGANRAFFEQLRTELQALEFGPVDLRALARLVLRYDANALLHGLFLAKKELAGGRLRLRTACDLICDGLEVTGPTGFVLPETAELAAALPSLIAGVDLFAEPRITEVAWTPAKGATRSRAESDDEGDGE